jgi:hypothetical protein
MTGESKVSLVISPSITTSTLSVESKHDKTKLPADAGTHHSKKGMVDDYHNRSHHLSPNKTLFYHHNRENNTHWYCEAATVDDAITYLRYRLDLPDKAKIAVRICVPSLVTEESILMVKQDHDRRMLVKAEEAERKRQQDKAIEARRILDAIAYEKLRQGRMTSMYNQYVIEHKSQIDKRNHEVWFPSNDNNTMVNAKKSESKVPSKRAPSKVFVDIVEITEVNEFVSSGLFKCLMMKLNDNMTNN